MRSQGNMVASREATKLPTCAINTLRAILLKNVLFPPRLGPVIMQKRLSYTEKTIMMKINTISNALTKQA